MYNINKDPYEEGKQREKLWGIEWPGHPSGQQFGGIENSLRDSPEDWECLHVEEDPAADYSYHDAALMKRKDGLYCLVSTSALVQATMKLGEFVKQELFLRCSSISKEIFQKEIEIIMSMNMDHFPK